MAQGNLPKRAYASLEASSASSSIWRLCYNPQVNAKKTTPFYIGETAESVYGMLLTSNAIPKKTLKSPWIQSATITPILSYALSSPSKPRARTRREHTKWGGAPFSSPRSIGPLARLHSASPKHRYYDQFQQQFVETDPAFPDSTHILGYRFGLEADSSWSPAATLPETTSSTPDPSESSYQGIGVIDEGVDGLREAGLLDDQRACDLAEAGSHGDSPSTYSMSRDALASHNNAPDGGTSNVYGIDEQYKEIAFTILKMAEKDEGYKIKIPNSLASESGDRSDETPEAELVAETFADSATVLPPEPHDDVEQVVATTVASTVRIVS